MSYTITDKCNGCQACTKICPVGAISGEKKGMHAIDGNGCIDCGSCGRICPQGALLDGAGRISFMVKRSQWKKPEIDEGVCMSCGVCVDSCPANCLALREALDAGDLHPYPFVAKEKTCLGCGICAFDCPVEAIRIVSP